jgi:hypothetical protein
MCSPNFAPIAREERRTSLMSLSIVTDYELSSVSTSKWAGISLLLKVGGGTVPLEFINTKTGVISTFNLRFAAAGWSLPVSLSSGLLETPSLATHSTKVLTTPWTSSFAISSIRGEFAAIMSAGAVASSVGYILFSHVPLTPIVIGGAAFLAGVFAGCAFTLPSTLYGSLAAGALSCFVS